MATTGPVNFIPLDFETIKADLVQYMKSQDTFKDVDFDASNINMLLDVLAYNTFRNSFYMNMTFNEMFLDTAQLRASIISHAKTLGYTPRSFRSARAVVDIEVVPSDPSIQSILMPKGTSFSSRAGSSTYTFTTDTNVVIAPSNGKFKATNVVLFEGSYVTESYVIKPASRYIISNSNVDTSSVNVLIIDSTGTRVLKPATGVIGLTPSDEVYFIQAAENNQYEIVFGDGVFGATPSTGSTIVVEYRVSAGELANGAAVFENNGLVGGSSNVTITTVQAAYGGAVPETDDEIRKNAPKSFLSQERAITTSDYETLLKTNFPEINDVSVYGGDLLDPPQYGRVFIAVDLDGVGGVTAAAQQEYAAFIKTKSPLTVQPVFVQPDTVYMRIEAESKFDSSITTKTKTDIETQMRIAIEQFNTSTLDGFNKTYYTSRLAAQLDGCDPSIIASGLRAYVYKILSVNLGEPFKAVVDFTSPLSASTLSLINIPSQTQHCMYSSLFVSSGKTVRLVDDGLGNVLMVRVSGEVVDVVGQVGSIDYASGVVNIDRDVTIDQLVDGSLRLYVTPLGSEYSASLNRLVSISEIQVSATAV